MKKCILVSLFLFAFSVSIANAVLTDNFSGDLSKWNVSSDNSNAQATVNSGNLNLTYTSSSTSYISSNVISKQSVNVDATDTITLTAQFMYPATNTNDWWAKTYSYFTLTPNSNGSLGNSIQFVTNMEDYADGVFDMTFGVRNSADTGWIKVYDDEIGSWDIANGKMYEIQMGINRGTNTAFLSLYNLTDSVSAGSTSFVYSGFTESNSYYTMMKGMVKTTDATKSISTGFKVDSITVIPEPATITLLGISSLLLGLKKRK